MKNSTTLAVFFKDEYNTALNRIMLSRTGKGGARVKQNFIVFVFSSLQKLDRCIHSFIGSLINLLNTRCFIKLRKD